MMQHVQYFQNSIVKSTLFRYYVFKTKQLKKKERKYACATIGRLQKAGPLKYMIYKVKNMKTYEKRTYENSFLLHKLIYSALLSFSLYTKRLVLFKVMLRI